MGTTINIKRQDTYNRNINYEVAGVLTDATGFTFYFTVRNAIPNTATQDDEEAIIAKVINGTASGIMPLELDGDDTNINPGKYVYEIQYKKPNGDLHSTITAQLIIEADITRAGAA